MSHCHYCQHVIQVLCDDVEEHTNKSNSRYEGALRNRPPDLKEATAITRHTIVQNGAQGTSRSFLFQLLDFWQRRDYSTPLFVFRISTTDLSSHIDYGPRKNGR